MKIPPKSIISFTMYNASTDEKIHLIGEYDPQYKLALTSTNLVTIKILDNNYDHSNLNIKGYDLFPASVLDTAVILYPNIESFYNENPEYLL